MSLHGWLRRFARTLRSLVRILAPAYVLVALLQASGLLEAFSVWLEVPLRLVGIGPEGVLPLMLGLFSALYAAIGSMASLGLAPEQALPVALFLSFAHALPVEVGVAARCRVNPWRMAAARVGMGVVAALAAPLLRPLLPPASGSGPAGAAHPAPLTEPALVVIGNSLLGLGKTWLLLVVILAPVTLAMEVLDGRGLIDRWSRRLAPRMAWLGFSPQAAFPILAGLFLGLVYGAGVIIDRMNKGKVSQREAWSMFLFLAACHSVLEDPFVFAAVGVGPQILLPVRLGAGVLVLAGLAVGTVRARRKAQAPPEGMRSAGSRRRAAVAGGLAVSLLAVLALAAAVLPGSSGHVWPGPRTSGEGPARSVELVVSAAASLADAAQPLKAAFEARHPGVRVLFNFGSSGALRHQI
ncbi:MAG: nucleoside recognition domain-containing protein, partial [Bacillota bacterium]